MICTGESKGRQAPVHAVCAESALQCGMRATRYAPPAAARAKLRALLRDAARLHACLRRRQEEPAPSVAQGQPETATNRIVVPSCRFFRRAGR